MKIYHNPRCSKSRQTLALIQENTSDFEIIKYLEDPLSFNDIKLLLTKLNVSPIKIVRTKEKIWKENFKSKKIDDNEIIKILAKNPKLMERPIVETNNKAIVGRPPENVLELFN